MTTIATLLAAFNALSQSVNNVKSCTRDESTARVNALSYVVGYSGYLQSLLDAGVRKSSESVRLVESSRRLIVRADEMTAL